MRLLLLQLVSCLSFVSLTFGQTTIATNHTNNNGNGSVTFYVENTNAFDIIITDVNAHLGTSAANNVQLLYNTVPYNDLVTPWSFGIIGAGQNGWVSAGTAVVNSNTANGVVPALTGLSLTVPAGATYQLGFSANTIQYMTLVNGSGANINTFTSGGVNLKTGDGISWGGLPYPATPGNYPRGFIGSITFIAAVPCTAPPIAGTVSAATNPVCPSVNNNLTISGGTGGTGQTYQWQSSPSGLPGSYLDIAGATNNSYLSNQTANTYYRFYTTCSAMTDTSAALLVTMSPFMDCYCASSATTTADEEIYNLTVNGDSTDILYSYANGCTTPAPGPGSILSRYSNFKTLAPITSIAADQTVSFSIVQDECDVAPYYANGMAIWIDYNQNGSFADPGEQVFVEAATALGPRVVTGTFVVPGTATLGNTVLRVISAEGISGAGLTPCLSYGYGETEDHLITLTCAPGSSTDTQTACDSYMWMDGNTYTASNNTATFVISNGAANGCDSIVNLNLTINTTASGTDVQTACGSYTWLDGNTYTANNNTATYTFVGGAASGCDSIVTLDLTINPLGTSTDVQTACVSYVWIDGNTYTASNNSATYVVGTAANGCDSIVTLDLTIITVNVAATNVGNTLSASASGAVYQWINCNGNTPIAGETNQTYAPTTNGSYAVIVTQNGCTDTSACMSTTIGLSEVELNALISVYPNPSNGTFTITGVEGDYRLQNEMGQLVQSVNLNANNNYSVRIENLSNGVYFIVGTYGEAVIRKEIIVAK